MVEVWDDGGREVEKGRPWGLKAITELTWDYVLPRGGVGTRKEAGTDGMLLF